MDDLTPATDPAEDDAPPNAADPKQYARAVRNQRQQAREAAEFWVNVLRSRLGRRIMWGLLTDCRTFEDVFAFGPNGFPDAQQTSFYRGQQQIGQRLWRTWLALAPAETMLMHREHDPALITERKR